MTIWDQMGAGLMMNQLAEECCELAQAALKYRRCIEEGNPTPVSREDAWNNLLEEIADVWLCIDLVPLTFKECVIISDIIQQKYDRWEQRLDAEKEETQ